MIVALLGKELQQHAAAFLGTAFLLTALVVLSLSFALNSEVNTLLTAATGFSYYGMPFAIAFLVRRLVVLEHEQRTHDFLAALPVSAFVRVSVKYWIGLIFSWAAGALAVLITALLVFRQELISLPWVTHVIVQVSAYNFAFYGITFGAAHLGRYRFTFWWILFPVVATLDQLYPDIWSWFLWHAVLADSIDVTRYHFPWSGLGITLTWGAIGTAVGFFLGTFRSGSMADEWFRPMTAGEKTGLILLVVTSWMALDVVDSLWVPGGPAYTRLASAGSGPTVVRVAGGEDTELWKTGQILADELDGLGAELDIRWPTLVLIRNAQQPDDAATLRSALHDEVVVEIDPEARRYTLLRDGFEAMIGHHSAWFPWYRNDRAWVAAGTSLYWLGPDPERPDSYALRAGYAAANGVTAADLADAQGLVLRFGPDVQAGISWAGLNTVERLAGKEAVHDLMAAVLGPSPSATLFGAARTDLRSGDGILRRTTGLDPEEFRREWLVELQSHHEAHREAIAALTPAWGTIRRDAGVEADVLFEYAWGADELPEDTAIRWVVLDPLQALPVRGQEIERRDLEEPTGRFPTPIDPRARVAVAFEVDSEALDGHVISGFEVDP